MRKRELVRLLERYAPIDAREASHRRELLALARAEGDCFSRDTFSPGHVTASAFVLDPSRRRLGLIHHPKLARWLQPGGHVEPRDRDLEAAARREAEEETGLGDLIGVSEGAFDLDVHSIPARADEPAHLHFDVRFAFVARSAAASAGEEVGGFRWVSLDRLVAGEAEVTDESVLRAARKLAEAGR